MKTMAFSTPPLTSRQAGSDPGLDPWGARVVEVVTDDESASQDARRMLEGRSKDEQGARGPAPRARARARASVTHRPVGAHLAHLRPSVTGRPAHPSTASRKDAGTEATLG